MRVPPVSTVFLVGLALASFVGLATMCGVGRHLAPAPLVAEIQLSRIVLPNNLRVDQFALTDALLERVRQRTGTDEVLRTSLETQGCLQPLEALMPRLITPSTLSEFIAASEPLSTILRLDDFRAAARITVSNHTDGVLDDVVVTLPAVFRAEDAEGRELTVGTTSGGLGYVRVGQLGLRESRSMIVWMAGSELDAPALVSRIRVGSAGVSRGRVYLFGASDWFGRDLEPMAWARWLVGGILALNGLAATAGLVLGGAAALRGSRRAPVPGGDT